MPGVLKCNIHKSIINRFANSAANLHFLPQAQHCVRLARLPMRRRVLATLSAAQPCTIVSCPGVGAPAIVTTVVTGDGVVDSSTVGAAERQPDNLAHFSRWLPAPDTSRGGGQGPRQTLRHLCVGQTLRQFSSARGDRPTLKTQLRELYKRVHPDKFQDHPVEQASLGSGVQEKHALPAQ